MRTADDLIEIIVKAGPAMATVEGQDMFATALDTTPQELRQLYEFIIRISNPEKEQNQIHRSGCIAALQAGFFLGREIR